MKQARTPFDSSVSCKTGTRIITLERFTPAFVDPSLSTEDLRRKFGTFLLTGTEKNCSLRKGLNAESKKCALKSPLFADDRNINEGLAKRYLEEAQRIMLLEEYRSALAVSNVKGFPRVYGIGSSGGFPVIVLEYINGTSLTEALDKLPLNDKGTGVSPSVAASIIQTATKILLNAQCLDGTFVHRDLSPRNILIKTDEHPLYEQVDQEVFDLRLVDMGSATYRIGTAPSSTIKHGIWRFGTAEYAAPEMLTRDIEGIEAKRYSETIDTYALCSILYLLLTGEPPFSLFKRVNSSPYLVKTKEEPKKLAVAPGCDALLQLAIDGITAQQERRHSLRSLYQALSAWNKSHKEDCETPPPTKPLETPNLAAA